MLIEKYQIDLDNLKSFLCKKTQFGYLLRFYYRNKPSQTVVEADTFAADDLILALNYYLGNYDKI